MSESFDYIIIGAGSAGCVLANRLSADGKHSVLLLEAGPSDRNLWVQMPLGYGFTFFNPKLNWMYDTQKDQGLNNRSAYWPRGKVLGGSSSINAMVYIRGLAIDFNHWRDQGNIGWGWDDVLPIFKSYEDYQGQSNTQSSRELSISDMTADVHPLCQQFLQGAESIGYSYTQDFNNEQMEGVGIYPINTRKGWRASSSNAFLRPAMKRPNVTVRTNAQATRILFSQSEKNDDAKTHSINHSRALTCATGVEYLKQGSLHQVHARKEVIVSGGAVNSPQLLQLSGIGDPELLTKLGIPVVVPNASVGRHMQDHLALTHYYKCTKPTINNELYPLLGKLKVGLQYVFKRKGLLSMSVNQAGGFVRAGETETEPNLQLYFNPLTYTLTPGDRKLMNPDPYPAFSMSFNACRPESRGHINIQSPDPLDKPLIHPNYLATEKDIQEAIAGCKVLRKLSQSDAIQSIITEETTPGLAVQTDDALLADFRERAGTIYHAVGTCRMGSDPTDSVVDSRLRVHGVAGLRVIDASIFPAITSGNTNAPSMMVGAKGAAMILEDNAV
ncbi:MAG: GMC family oxidoreductase [Leucothrix sp.]